MRTTSADQIIIKIVGHDPDGTINATEIYYMRGRNHIAIPKELRLVLSKAIREWSREIAKEQN